MRAPALAVVGALTVAAAGCYESGPLGAGPADAGKDWNTQQDQGVVDVVEDLPGTDDGAEEVDAGPPCLIDDECAELPDDDLCAGQWRCIDYSCQRDPATAVTCEDDGDPCTIEACDPGTGQCGTTPSPACVCKPLKQLGCFSNTSLSSADPGATTVLGGGDGYSCGPDTGAGQSEHVWTFTSPETTPVVVSLDADGSGGIWVLGYDGQNCVEAACIAGGKKQVGFEAQAGFDYALVFEHGDAAAVLAEVSVQCGVQSEFSCDNGIDDDANGLTDCEDTACLGVGDCPEGFELECDDDIDNDEDGSTDCADPDCQTEAVCLQTCQSSINAYCGFSQGIGIGGGKANSTDYACGPAADGKEIVYTLGPSVSGTFQVSLSASASEVGLYLMVEQGFGCTPTSCDQYSPSQLNFVKQAGSTYYVAVDAPATVPSGTTFGIDFECL